MFPYQVYCLQFGYGIGYVDLSHLLISIMAVSVSMNDTKFKINFPSGTEAGIFQKNYDNIVADDDMALALSDQ